MVTQERTLTDGTAMTVVGRRSEVGSLCGLSTLHEDDNYRYRVTHLTWMPVFGSGAPPPGGRMRMGGLDDDHELSNVLTSRDEGLIVSERRALIHLQRPIRINMDSDALFHVKQLFWQGRHACFLFPNASN